MRPCGKTPRMYGEERPEGIQLLPVLAKVTGMCHHVRVIFLFLVETGFCYVGHAGLDFLSSDDPPAYASQSAGITGVSHCAWPAMHFSTLSG
uniref:Uncharacterized protein n=1 Tax=Callithrix jacchus TaxID=9483 RepID=A0A8I3W8E0_CALJA